jgi:beta-galactosidase GanA
MKFRNLFLSLAALASCAATLRAAAESLPQLVNTQGRVQLMVDGHPLFLRAGELGNSSGESGYLRPFWPKLKGLNLNAVIAPVTWEQIESLEGQFDFADLDTLITDARAQNMRLVLLWFGAWKNSMSCYAPAWVKRDFHRFPRALDANGRALEILTPFSDANRDADSRAFAQLMRHLKAFDGAKRTVVIIQVENEIGMIGDPREHSDLAQKRFDSAVPAGLLNYIEAHADAITPELRTRWVAAGKKQSGTWTEVFGQSAATEEFFMAYGFAEYVDAVAKAGKAEYALPMYTNAALIRPGYQPGQYPAGGPLPHLYDVWRAGAPTLDFLAPDIYFQNYGEWQRRYEHPGEALFVPESAPSREACVHVLYTFARPSAIGDSAFAIESIGEAAGRDLSQAFSLISQLEPIVQQHPQTSDIAGLMSEGPEQRQPQQVHLGGYTLSVAFEQQPPAALADGVVAPTGPVSSTPSGGVAITTGLDEFIIAGTGITVTFQARSATAEQVGLLSVEEGHFENGQWIHRRWLNGDETNQGRHVRIAPGSFGLQRVKLYRYR